jgi:alpha-L-rhamnosidase
VTSSIKPEQTNVIGVEVAEGWYAGRLAWDDNRHLFGDRIGVLAQLEVTFGGGNRFVLASDGSWKYHRSAVVRSEIYDGEDYDSREQKAGWNSDASFDDSTWTSVEELGFPAAKVLASDTPPVRSKERVSPVKIFKSPSSKVLLDFGQNLVGKLEVQLPTVDSEGHSVSFSHAEVLEQDELGTRPLRKAKPIDTVILSRSTGFTWSPKFTFHGFRYVQVDGWPTKDGMPGQDQIIALVMYSDMTRTGHFSCSDDMVNSLHQNVFWSMKGNFLSIPTDCPQRDERLGWTGDIQVFSPTANFLFNTSSFMGNWLEDLAAEQLEEGQNSTPGLVVPDVLRNSTIPKEPQAIWHDAAVLTPWDSYQSSGDLEILRRQYPSMRAWVDKGIKTGPNGLWDQNIWQLGDWLDPAAPPDMPGLARTDNVLVADAYLVHVLETITQISALLDETADHDRYRNRAARVRQAFAHEYITPAGLLVGDTQTAHALALVFNLYDSPAHTAKSASRLVHLVHQGKYRIATGFAGTPVICHALSRTGHAQLAYRMLLEKACPSWLYPITMGATTIWERWDSLLPDGRVNPGEMTSFNHYALGSVADWLHGVVGGLSPSEPGWRRVLVRPVPGGTLTWAEVKYEGPYGRVECKWRIVEEGKRFEVDVLVPPNSEAVVVLPGEEEGKGNGKERRVVGSGRHHFECAYEAPKWPPVPELRRSNWSLIAEADKQADESAKEG